MDLAKERDTYINRVRRVFMFVRRAPGRGTCDRPHRHRRQAVQVSLSMYLTMHAHAYNDVCQVTRTPHNAI